MAGKALSSKSTGAEKEAEIWVKKPASNSSREIRDNILKELFGYTEEDIKQLDIQKAGYFYISDSSDTKNWATVNQVRDWKPNTNGEVPISMPQTLIDNLILFREQQADFEIFKVGMFINDGEVRRQITDALKAIISDSGDKRIKALDNLMLSINGSSTTRDEIFRALRFLSNESGYKNNPFLMIAMARAGAYKSDNPASSQINQTMIGEATKATNANLYYNTSKSPFAKMNKAEAARVNFWASDLYRQMNLEDKSIQRRWIERYLTISADERASLKEGDVIEFIPPGQAMVDSSSKSVRDLRLLDEERAKRLKQEEAISKIGNPNPPNDPRDKDYYWKPSDRLEMRDSVVSQKDRHTKDGGKRSKFKVVSLSSPVNRLGNKIDKVNPILNIITEILKYVAADRRMFEIAEYYNKRRLILNQLDRESQERTRVVPPRPEVIIRAINKIRRYGITSADQSVKGKIPKVLRELEIMLEESYAYYK